MLDINKIAQDKITAMHESGEVKEYIEKQVESLVLNGIKNALDGYKIRNAVEEKVKEDVSGVITTLDFTAYNSFIAEKIKQLAEVELREDISQKIQETFNSIFIKKRDTIKLSEIFGAYRKFLIEDMEESEMYELDNHFYAEIAEDEKYKWLTISASKSEPTNKYGTYSKRSECDFSFNLHRNYQDKSKGWIGSATFEGKDVNKSLTVKSHNKFETLILNLVYNATPIEIDIEDEDDIDNSLDLDI